ncbi:MAG: adenylate/guanylate cyclase domain-containing protein [Planctomycetota bacterium]|nr:adenylate/guanylate cyclase domain-containing protein [Planctomycetota bacterium]
MKKTGANLSRTLPPIILGVGATLLVVLANYLIHVWRFSVKIEDSQAARSGALPGAEFRPASDALSLRRLLILIVNRSDALINDLMFFFRDDFPRGAGRERVVLVAVDRESIARFGNWPWPRDVIARILDRVSGAEAIGLDFMFNEPDRMSLENYLPLLSKAGGLPPGAPALDPSVLNNDLRLAGAISRVRTVLGVLFTQTSPSRVPAAPAEFQRFEFLRPNGEPVSGADTMLWRSRGVIRNLDTLRAAQKAGGGEGFLNLFPDSDGGVRSIPLFGNVAPGGVGWRTYPSFPLEMLRVSLGGEGYRILLRDGDAGGGNHYSVREVEILGPDRRGLLRLPLDEMGQMEFNFRNANQGLRIYPAWEVIGGRYDGAFADKLVIVGKTYDEFGYQIPVFTTDREFSLPGIHAAMLAAMLDRDFMVFSFHDSHFRQQAAIIGCGLAATAAMAFGSMGVGLMVSLLSLLAVVLGNYHWYFREGQTVGMTMPLAAILFFTVVQLVSDYLLVGRERRFIREALSQNVSSSILGYLERHHDSLSSLQGEQRNMSVIFTDIRGFTSISEKMTAPELARFLHEYFTPMFDIVMEHLGTVDKFIGDGLMAFWNAPADNPAHARDAAGAALDMLDRLESLQKDWSGRGLPRISIGCGINTGPMFAGYMGSEQRKNYTVMGDNVNIASRLEGLNKIYSSNILISESTRSALGGDFICRVADKVRVSGKEIAILIYELMGRGEGTDEDREELATFARVFELYLMREFTAAEALLKELMFIRQAPIYNLYLDRLAIYKALPPPPDWDGTFSMRSK